jgi:hypothetical protein
VDLLRGTIDGGIPSGGGDWMSAAEQHQQRALDRVSFPA